MTEQARAFEARMRHDPRQRLEWLRQEDLIHGGLIAGSVALVQPLLTSPDLDLAGGLAVVSFSVAIPLLAALLMLGQQEEFRQRPSGVRVAAVAKSVGQGAAFLGVAAVFWHVSWVAGVAFVASAVAGLLVHGEGYSRLEGLDGVGDPPDAGAGGAGSGPS